ncbi:ribosomal RNA processing protein 36 homolog [Cimex lectularius]|uniref:rRNA biogenesis protein RRP36 n=1 Tax=Cimex lectularius TaxID=79782 RepID=A0A8I6THV3_CIMLE|nr:ribosomal RNA processing protein 36 homolog [Cimex lectularius]
MSRVGDENLSFEERLRTCAKTKKWKKPAEAGPFTARKANKKKPREESSKIRLRRSFASKIAPPKGRDPRFDSLCGEFNQADFKESYSFLKDVKQKEEQALKSQLRVEKDAERKEQIRSLLKKYKDRALEKERIEKKKQKEFEQSQKVKQALKEGKPARFRNKAEKQISDLVDKFEELKSKGKLEKYLKKKSKKLKKSDTFGKPNF